MEASRTRLTKTDIDRLTKVQAEQAQQQALAVIVLGGLGVYLLMRAAEVVFGGLAVGAKVAREGMEKAAKGMANNSRAQLPPCDAST